MMIVSVFEGCCPVSVMKNMLMRRIALGASFRWMSTCFCTSTIGIRFGSILIYRERDLERVPLFRIDDRSLVEIFLSIF